MATFLSSKIRSLIRKLRDFLNRFLPDEEWRLVHTISFGIDQTQPLTNTKKVGKFYYHLYESETGKRRVEYASTLKFNKSSEEVGKEFEDYHDTIFPWLHRRYVSGIPTFHEVPQHDIMNKLSEP